MTERVEAGPDPASAAKTVDVAVVGGGLSGLAAARRILQKPGKTVVVLEASDRVGGRLLDAHFGATGVAELGGEWVAPDQKHVTALIAELGLATTPTFTAGCTTLNYQGKVTHFSSSDGLPALPALDLAEVAWAFAQLTDMAATVPLDAPQTAPQAAYWDSLTVEEWINTNLSTDGAKFLVRVSARRPTGIHRPRHLAAALPVRGPERRRSTATSGRRARCSTAARRHRPRVPASFSA